MFKLFISWNFYADKFLDLRQLNDLTKPYVEG